MGVAVMPEPARRLTDDEWLTSAQAVAYTKLSRQTLIRREKEGLLEVGRTCPGGPRRYSRRALDAMLKSNGLMILLLWLVALALAVDCALTHCNPLHHFGLVL